MRYVINGIDPGSPEIRRLLPTDAETIETGKTFLRIESEVEWEALRDTFRDVGAIVGVQEDK